MSLNGKFLGLPHGMGTSAMMGMGMGLGGPMSGYYPTNSLYATLLAQSKSKNYKNKSECNC